MTVIKLSEEKKKHVQVKKGWKDGSVAKSN